MCRRLNLLLTVMFVVLSAQTEARCRRPLPDSSESVELTASNVEIYPVSGFSPVTAKHPVAKPAEAIFDEDLDDEEDESNQTKTAPPLAKPKPSKPTDAGQSGESADGKPATYGDANGTGGGATSDGGGPSEPPKPQQPEPAAKLTAADPSSYVPAAVPPASTALSNFSTYSVSAGETLRTALTRWTSGSGWELVWDAPNDYSISAPADFDGELTQAVTQLMDSLRVNGAPFGADIWQGNRVIRVNRNR